MAAQARTSEAASLVGTWRYRPFNHGRHPGDLMKDHGIERQLGAIGDALSIVFPGAVNAVTPDAVLQQLHAHGEAAWCEQRWIDDYSAAITEST